MIHNNPNSILQSEIIETIKKIDYYLSNSKSSMQPYAPSGKF